MRLIEMTGPISIAAFMAESNAHYYGHAIPFGATGDFVTAPDISQMFGELVGLWAADLWLRAGTPEPFHLVELGPGRGTLMADALRAMRGFGAVPTVHLVETSAVLRAEQSGRIPGAIHHDDMGSVPDDAPLIIIANEFFDALPIRQLIATHSGWRERVLGRDKGALIALPGTTPMDLAVPPSLKDQPPGSIIETCPAAVAIMQDCAQRIADQGGAMLVIDYGHDAARVGNTLQAVRAHQKVDPFDNPGACDLTAHVDFGALCDAARIARLETAGPVRQGYWLTTLGIDQRLASLCESAPQEAEALQGQRDRLVNADAMGDLFRVFACYHPEWPAPEGFATA
jgi:SAM-dependent MidA family methyltransferase